MTDEEFQRFVVQLREPFRTVALLCVSLGLRISECMALKWSDVDWLDAKLTVERGIVTGELESENARLAAAQWLLAPEILAVLQKWKTANTICSGNDWIFASRRSLAACRGPIPRAWRVFRDAAMAAGLGRLDAHMRHTYRSWLDAWALHSRAAKADAALDIRTTMNVYGDVVTDEMAQAHSEEWLRI